MPIATPYCSVANVRVLATEITADVIDDAAVTGIIAQADAEIEVELSRKVAISDLRLLSAIPPVLGQLSLYLARGYCYKKLYGNRTDNPDGEDLHKYWMTRYTTVLESVLSGELPIASLDGTSEGTIQYNINRDADYKTLGSGEYGDYVPGVD
jgi:hypothetical protein